MKEETSSVAAHTINVLSLCSGVGMLDLAVRLALPGARTVCYVEREAYCVQVLVARMREGSLDEAPVWDDMATFSGTPFHGCVDAVIAGLPCQPYSVAGRQRGNEDERAFGAAGDGPVPHALRIIAECQPALVFLENVPAWVTGGHFRGVGEELCRMGYTVEEPLFLRASDVGAPHRRERVFILAHAIRNGERGREWPPWSWWGVRGDGCAHSSAVADTGRPVLRGRRRRRDVPKAARGVEGAEDKRQRNGDAAGDGSADVGNAESPERRADRKPGLPPERASRYQPGNDGELVGDPSVSGLARRSRQSRDAGTEQPAAERASLFPPGPGDFDGWGRVVADGSFDFRAPAVKPGVRVLADGLALVVDESRIDQLRASGNGVVAVQGAVALAVLLGRVREGANE